MLDFTNNKILDLHIIPESLVNRNVRSLLFDNEEIIYSFSVIRDQVVFTNCRLISVEAQGITGTQQEIFILPYRKIQYFGFKTAGLGELIPTSELFLFFSDGHNASFKFQEKVDILKIAKAISSYCI